MDIAFIGVGEAFDPSLGNCSYLIKSTTNLMIDCGYAVPRNFFEMYDAELVDALYLTHFHPDHTWGIFPLFFRWKQDGRKKPLTILGQQGIEAYVKQLLDFAQPDCLNQLTFPIRFIEVQPYMRFNELGLSFAETDHSIKNLAVRVDHTSISVGFSGDGDLTEASKRLFHPCDILIHETFRVEEIQKGHTSLKKVLEYANSLPKLQILACVHFSRDERSKGKEMAQIWQQRLPFALIIPEPQEVLKRAGTY